MTSTERLHELAYRLWPDEGMREKWLAAKARVPLGPVMAISSCHEIRVGRTPRTMEEADGRRHVSL